MKKLISMLITVMMMLALIPYTAFAEAGSEGVESPEVETITKEMVIGEPEEVTLELLVSTKVTVESDDSGSAYGILTSSSLIISDGIALYCSTIKIMPTKIGTATLTVKSNGEVVQIYNIEVKPEEKITETHIGQTEIFEYISHYDEEVTNTNAEKVTSTVVSKNQRNTTSTINGVLVTEVLYVYKVGVDYQEVGSVEFSLIGSKSGEFYKVTSDVVEHDFEWIIDTPASIQAPGEKHEACGFCGATRNEGTVIEQLSHDHIITAVAGTEATCTEDGVTEHFTCEACGKIYSDADGENLIASADVIITAKGHEYEWVVDKEPTEDTDGMKHEKCAACEAVRSENTVIDKLSHTHDMIRTIAREATCETDGNIEFYVCTICMNSFTDVYGEHAVDPANTIVKASGHNYSEWQTMNPATCTRKGYKFASCQKCGRPEIKEIPLKQHILKDYVIEPTCTEDGANVTECDKCRYKVADVIPAKGHREQKVTAMVPTCTRDGRTEGTQCADCSEYIVVPDILPATGHTYGEWNIDTNPTCAETGTKHRDCIDCGTKDRAEIDKLEHTVEVMPAVDATCTATGLTEGVFCTLCKAVLNEQDTVAMLDHNWDTEYTVDRRATIKSGGSMSYHCADCNIANKDSAKKIYMIKKISVGDISYSSTIQTPDVIVIDTSGKRLKRGTDFTVSFKNSSGMKVRPRDVGAYKATVTFKGKYNGSVTKSFKIIPEKTVVKSLAAGKRSFTVKWAKRTEQVTGYQIKYSTNYNMDNSKYILAGNNKTISKTITKLKAKKKYWVQVRTYKTVKGVKYWSKWSAKKSVVTK